MTDFKSMTDYPRFAIGSAYPPDLLYGTGYALALMLPILGTDGYSMVDGAPNGGGLIYVNLAVTCSFPMNRALHLLSNT